MMTVLLCGAAGQLGWELQRSCPDNIELHALSSSELDVRDQSAVLAAVERISPTTIINAAAYTAVDKAESDAQTAFAVNAEGAANLAMAALEQGARLIQVSTDYVFDGSNSMPYRASDTVSPLGVYGESKYRGEEKVQELLPDDSVILRTSWLYSSHGNNFVKTMLHLMAERNELGIVADQIGSPTYAYTLALAVWEFCSRPQLSGVYHWSDAGIASWYDFAYAIMEEGVAAGLLPHEIALKPIRTEDYPTAARRPAYSVLDNTDSWEQLGIAPLHWRVALREMLGELERNSQG